MLTILKVLLIFFWYKIQLMSSTPILGSTEKLTQCRHIENLLNAGMKPDVILKSISMPENFKQSSEIKKPILKIEPKSYSNTKTGDTIEGLVDLSPYPPGFPPEYTISPEFEFKIKTKNDKRSEINYSNYIVANDADLGSINGILIDQSGNYIRGSDSQNYLKEIAINAQALSLRKGKKDHEHKVPRTYPLVRKVPDEQYSGLCDDLSIRSSIDDKSFGSAIQSKLKSFSQENSPNVILPGVGSRPGDIKLITKTQNDRKSITQSDIGLSIGEGTINESNELFGVQNYDDVKNSKYSATHFLTNINVAET
ncbi:uncharacterized protein LOC141850132 [Brevipalpus obovatus]|uniref:uncharacterized protein LOC141850132 n=1 Tax=Brevipalpus obovatus TaxID=246614 RepID=UPI003D9F5F80